MSCFDLPAPPPAGLPLLLVAAAALIDTDGRILLAGEHASYIPAWQEGALLSSLDAITRLHQRVVAG